MWVLSVHLDGVQTQQYLLVPGTEYLVGRLQLSGNHISINKSHVSKKHLRVCVGELDTSRLDDFQYVTPLAVTFLSHLPSFLNGTLDAIRVKSGSPVISLEYDPETETPLRLELQNEIMIGASKHATLMNIQWIPFNLSYLSRESIDGCAPDKYIKTQLPVGVALDVRAASTMTAETTHFVVDDASPALNSDTSFKLVYSLACPTIRLVSHKFLRTLVESWVGHVNRETPIPYISVTPKVELDRAIMFPVGSSTLRTTLFMHSIFVLFDRLQYKLYSEILRNCGCDQVLLFPLDQNTDVSQYAKLLATGVGSLPEFERIVLVNLRLENPSDVAPVDLSPFYQLLVAIYGKDNVIFTENLHICESIKNIDISQLKSTRPAKRTEPGLIDESDPKRRKVTISGKSALARRRQEREKKRKNNAIELFFSLGDAESKPETQPLPESEPEVMKHVRLPEEKIAVLEEAQPQKATNSRTIMLSQIERNNARTEVKDHKRLANEESAGKPEVKRRRKVTLYEAIKNQKDDKVKTEAEENKENDIYDEEYIKSMRDLAIVETMDDTFLRNKDRMLSLSKLDARLRDRVSMIKPEWKAKKNFKKFIKRSRADSSDSADPSRAAKQYIWLEAYDLAQNTGNSVDTFENDGYGEPPEDRRTIPKSQDEVDSKEGDTSGFQFSHRGYKTPATEQESTSLFVDASDSEGEAPIFAKGLRAVLRVRTPPRKTPRRMSYAEIVDEEDDDYDEPKFRFKSR
ncbi:hypothetical protein BABINDRAFT_169363 [Babjeviella inositovora NRRL Y-12698]|uniref:Uncharacterized protein n=1 Tax=Babjeviella inositovora NRRL Y-12698 TaxID=984486 RepID=A0A1E3QHR8_9ASCO|nr:uncharacterized protein BABINDRAFT_169363 [Babjeviella inositovora NRRL Y-12698]ODQ77239.1 hypothetical protein BABINDRAFT_169363 [Babjeviella inositovora NRRL Y-12698]